MTDKQAAAIQAGKRIAGGKGLSSVLLRRASEVELDWDVRQKSRIEATDSLGRPLNVFLPRGTVLRGGDVLVCEDGSLVRVKAAPQPVLVVTHCADHGTPFDLLRAAYHLGNRHVPLELQPDRLLLEPDHVLADMLRMQHLIVTETSSAFEPEGGAYGAGGGAHAGHAHGHEHAHDHAHKHDHAHDKHDQGHDHGHSHDKPKASGRAIGIPVVGQAAPHVHGPDCNHDHGHGHGHKKHDH
ncbi:MAG: urease accessory protein UreE [Pseudomonadota bacterium]|nr:urease accessory protein UreE [Pseudomonadota bacterium]